jgi:hypothetical protein
MTARSEGEQIAPGARRLGTMGRSAQWLPDEAMLLRKLWRTHFSRPSTKRPDSSLRYRPSDRSCGSVSRAVWSGSTPRLPGGVGEGCAPRGALEP